jgi:hypothetical protein
MLQGFLRSRLVSAFRRFCGRCNDLVYNCRLSFGRALSGIFCADGWTVLDTLTLTADNSIRIRGHETGLTAGVIDQQGMLTYS